MTELHFLTDHMWKKAIMFKKPVLAQYCKFHFKEITTENVKKTKQKKEKESKEKEKDRK